MIQPEIPAGALWLPGVGVSGTDERAAAKAIHEYDPDLILGRRQDTGEWIVFLKDGPMGEPFPVLGLGTRLPAPDELTRKLYNSDVRRHGVKIFKQIQARNDALERERRHQAEEADAMMADALVSGFRNQGFNPFPTSYRNLHPKNRKYRKKD